MKPEGCCLNVLQQCIPTYGRTRSRKIPHIPSAAASGRGFFASGHGRRRKSRQTAQFVYPLPAAASSPADFADDTPFTPVLKR